MRERHGVLTGMTAGLIAAGVMSAARLIAHRAGGRSTLSLTASSGDARIRDA